jgi:hypothetical protein
LVIEEKKLVDKSLYVTSKICCGNILPVYVIAVEIYVVVHLHASSWTIKVA